MAAALLVLSALASPSWSAGTQATPENKSSENNELNPADSFLCRSQTRGFETALGVPAHLLTAISLAESGKWDETNKALFAWPWTVMAEGKGHYMPSKASAISKVRVLQARGIKNIDVGCMQINLYYHPKAFEDLNAAFDPERNVGYAANFLAALNQTTMSWPQAAANYHSTTTSKNEVYLNKVLGLWQKVSNKSIRGSGFRRSPDPAYANPIGRTAQVALLKSRFRARLSAERNANKPDKKKQDLEAWRRGRFDKNFMQATTALQKAEQARKDKNYLNKGKKTFASKRQSQLSQWRKNRSAAAFRN
ncbi:MAG: transglycosylase SLT domain-containing protein [Rhodospirillaceae bacterium]|mgnify:CR=1 FL=1|nr:transglycosylase SLT domain-containing protein [Rhodospirillaceae bacterium]MBT4588533.1 transglycosylase SLT domain-containing protein [Rhodospirillaceae bacterium]MBT4939391.1 transglycosylase SLT domain-containing protein [Rhodospirillaceae bacterium]MBT5939559.1 transglycosylase SLT domain-containing protein [Rhodospirillaceae bacterium]MBT7265947.1 transglycosylase SLT domain-containing protein [Rhodospirillaceae bacterium]